MGCDSQFDEPGPTARENYARRVQELERQRQVAVDAALIDMIGYLDGVGDPSQHSLMTHMRELGHLVPHISAAFHRLDSDRVNRIRMM